MTWINPACSGRPGRVPDGCRLMKNCTMISATWTIRDFAALRGALNGIRTGPKQHLIVAGFRLPVFPSSRLLAAFARRLRPPGGVTNKIRRSQQAKMQPRAQVATICDAK